MKNFIVYDPQSGEIEVYGTCQDFEFELHGKPGKGLMEATATHLTHYVVDGELVAYTAEQAQAKANRPDILWRWSNSTFSWSDPRSQAEQETELAAEARSKRTRLLAESDWTDTLSAQSRLGEVLYNAWQDYRQILRDVPQQAGFPTNIAWPDMPSPT